MATGDGIVAGRASVGSRIFHGRVLFDDEAMLMDDLSPRMDRRAAILQSCYIPWKGYFDIIAAVDVLVVYDDVKYSKNHWHNRNLIKTQHGLKWLTVPVSRRGDSIDSIDNMRIARPFAHKHWRSIAQAYAKAPFFNKYSEQLEACFKLAGGLDSLSAVNVLFIKSLCEELGIRTEIVWSRDLKSGGTPTERLVNICREVGANIYLSGPAAKAYIEQEQFAKSAIGLEWMDYSSYARYSQLHGPFAHGVTILDLILNEGPRAVTFLGARRRSPTNALCFFNSMHPQEGAGPKWPTREHSPITPEWMNYEGHPPT